MPTEAFPQDGLPTGVFPGGPGRPGGAVGRPLRTWGRVCPAGGQRKGLSCETPAGALGTLPGLLGSQVAPERPHNLSGPQCPWSATKDVQVLPLGALATSPRARGVPRAVRAGPAALRWVRDSQPGAAAPTCRAGTEGLPQCPLSTRPSLRVPRAWVCVRVRSCVWACVCVNAQVRVNVCASAPPPRSWGGRCKRAPLPSLSCSCGTGRPPCSAPRPTSPPGASATRSRWWRAATAPSTRKCGWRRAAGRAGCSSSARRRW